MIRVERNGNEEDRSGETERYCACHDKSMNFDTLIYVKTASRLVRVTKV